MLERLIRPLVAPRLHHPSRDWTIAEYRPAEGMALFFSSKATIPAEPRCRPSHLLLRHALSIRYGGLHPDEWRFARSGHGQLLVEAGGDAPLPRFSLSATDMIVVAALADTGTIGVDVETLARVSMNASRHDDWLSPEERAELRELTGSPLTVELACRWTLKEALGKAKGVGLAMPLASLTIRPIDRRPTLVATWSAMPSVEQYSLSLFGNGNLITAIAHRPTLTERGSAEHVVSSVPTQNGMYG